MTLQQCMVTLFLALYLCKKIQANIYSLLFCSTVSSDHSVSDASYAYKLKREKRAGPPTTSQELNEIVDNVSAVGELNCPLCYLAISIL